MSNKKVWFITGASRGMGADFAKAALAAGYAVVASARDTTRVSKTLGQSNDLMPVKPDVTSRADAEAAVQAAVDRFGRIDDRHEPLTLSPSTERQLSGLEAPPKK